MSNLALVNTYLKGFMSTNLLYQCTFFSVIYQVHALQIKLPFFNRLIKNESILTQELNFSNIFRLLFGRCGFQIDFFRLVPF